MLGTEIVMSPEEHENIGWCHINAQYSYHATAKIEGTRTALIAIRDAIDRALLSGMDAEARELFTADGEGYGVKVSIRNYDWLCGQTPPYTAHWAGGVGSRELEAAMDQRVKMEELLAEHYEIHNS